MDIKIIGTDGTVIDECTICPMCAALAMSVNTKKDKFVCLSCTAFFGIN